MSSESPPTAAVPGGPLLTYVRPLLAALLTGGSLAWSADLYRAVGLVLFPEQIMAGMFGIGLALVFVHYPRVRGTERTSVPWYDIVAALVGLVSGMYVAVVFPALSKQLTMDSPPLIAIAVSFVFVFLAIEGLRRAAGYALLLIVLFFVVYALVGHLIPGDLQTREVDPVRFVSYLALDNNGLFGFAMAVTATVILTFVFFGQLLLRSGGSAFFNDISLVLMGRYRGGSAKIAITASSLFGSISGVAVSNIVATGVVTIPLMKRGGYKPEMAAAVEAVASTGGQLMPPVMGAVAFLMADFLEVAYREIVIAAIVPSFLYYVSLFIQADLEAAKAGITRVREEDIPNAAKVMRFGWYFILPFAVLVYGLFWLNWEPETAAILSCLVTMIIGFTVGYGGQRMRLSDIWESFTETGLSILDILMIVAGANFIIGILSITGLGFAFTAMIAEFGGQNLFLMLLITGVLCILLGMGMPTAGVYILLAVLLAPSLVEVGINPLAAHMFILYLGMMSLITPPVAVAAFFAASIAKAKPMTTGWVCMRFGWTAYVVPFLFVFSPSLLLQGDVIHDLWLDVSTAVGGVWLITASLIGYFVRPMSWPMRGGYMAAGVLLMLPYGLVQTYTTIIAGLVLGIAVVLWEIAAKRRTDAAAIGARP